jgi:hypothetical protein
VGTHQPKLKARLAAAFWTKGPAPIELVRFQLLDRFKGWTIEYVKSIPLADALELWACMEMEAKAIEAARNLHK